jgi:hypothetical protein
VNAIVNNNILRSQIDNNPSRYVILNGLPADKDPTVKRGEIKENDSAPYYPYFDPSKHPEPKKVQKYHSNLPIYHNDKKPYYGASQYVVHTPTPPGTPVKVVLQDLDANKVSVDNIITLQKQLDDINIQLTSTSKTYYDPTRADKEKKKVELTKRIEDMKNQLRADQALQIGENNTVTEVTKQDHVKVENARNVDVESTNKSIAENFWYDVPRDVNTQQRKTQVNTIPAARKNNLNSQTENLHPDSQGLKTERVRIISLRKLRHN